MQSVARFLVTAFFAIVFLQSALDKIFDRDGNMAYFSDHFKNSPFPPESMPVLLSLLTLLEATAGGLCALGVLLLRFRAPGFGLAACGVTLSAIALLGLLLGQRLAKDYAGAAVVAAYFAVAVLGVLAF